ncbi:MAG: lmo0937 family membrane protein [Candidatus Moranbacteria bacterium]|nr:lmo0937 family membrane protein [Candidatus Moranbacteria bacterium]
MWAIIVILIVLWALGLLTSYTLGGLLHILLVVAIILVVVRLLQGRSVV